MSRENAKTLACAIETGEEGMQLGTYLRQRMGFTRAQIRSVKFRQNGLRVNGERARVTRVLKTGDLLEVLLEDPAAGASALREDYGRLDVLYEDEDVLAVWKEAGLVIHPSHGHYSDSLSNRVHTYFAGRKETVRVRSIGRLDKDTSGIVVFAKNQIAAARLWKQKEEGTFWKEYLAVCEGRMFPGKPDGTEDGKWSTWHTVDTPIRAAAGEKMKMCAAEDGQRAVTHYQVLCTGKKRTFLRVRIETGRTHQIRVHMASIGYPVAGDVIYGRADAAQEGSAAENLCLYAWKTRFCQPFTGEAIEIAAAAKF
ncbi:MAG TPA: RluA family pseudouridine synthase [Candidatus Choladousia intestinipullorum]|nr:RluA family pseudouridine synthase [Candidatus Choladousia intestinipullorum]